MKILRIILKKEDDGLSMIGVVKGDNYGSILSPGYETLLITENDLEDLNHQMNNIKNKIIYANNSEGNS